MWGTGRLSRRVIVAAAEGGLTAALLVTTGGQAGAATGGGATAGNPYAPAYGHPYRHGAVPTVAQLRRMNAYAAAQGGSASTPSYTLSYGGGPVGVTEGAPRVYVVFWGSQWGAAGTDSNGDVTLTADSAGAAPYLQQLFKGLGTGNELWSGTVTQYCDGSAVTAGATSCPAGSVHVGYPTGGALAGVWYDATTAEPTAATGNQLANEAIRAAAHFNNTSATANRDVQYDIVSAPGLDPDNYLTGGFCAWHDWNGDPSLTGGAASSPYGPIAFTNMPYLLDLGASCGENFVNTGSAGTLDGFSIVNGHEFAETVSDQEPGYGWYNFSSGQENGDECAWITSGSGAAADVSMGDGAFAMQSTWSNDTGACAISHPIVTATSAGDTVTVTNPGNQRTARNTAVSLAIAATDSASVQTLTYSATGLPRGLKINSSTGVISGTTSNWAHTYSVTVKATDGTGAYGTASFSWTIHR